MIFICGHYKGIDERVRDKYVTREVSIGDYVLSGGELAAAVSADAIIRLLPGALGDESSALTDSFQMAYWPRLFIHDLQNLMGKAYLRFCSLDMTEI